MPKALVSLARAGTQRLSDDDVVDVVRECLEPLGGIETFVGRGDTVVLKPNQTVWFLARDGVTTDPRIVAALVTLCRAAGARRVVVGDSCGGDLRTTDVLDVTGVRRLALKAGADDVVGLEDLPHTEVQVRAGDERHRVKIPKLLLDADVIVNLPKAKTHFEDAISCCLKNWVGLIHQRQRAQFMVDPLLFQVTAGLHRRVPADLHVVDALWVGEGNGPAANHGTWMGAVVAGTDPVATDTTVGRLMGFDSDDLVFAREGARVGLGTNRPSEIGVLGEPVRSVAMAVQPTAPGYAHLPIRVLTGDGVTWAGSLGHFKSIADVFDKYHLWTLVEKVHGPPTFMIGRVHDPDFEAHVTEGPYFVIDDAAYDEYRTDDRVVFIPGHPATHNIFPYLFRRFSVRRMGPRALRLMAGMKRVRGYVDQPTWRARPRAARSRRQTHGARRVRAR